MPSMDRTAPGARVGTRALAVLAVLLGLLAMHGLASTHHASAATTAVQHGAAQHPAAPADAWPGHQHAADEHQHASAVVVAQDAADTIALENPACDDDCPDLAVLCVAVLTGAALLVLLLARDRAPLLAAPPQRDRATRAPPVRVARPPDPVKELCVSRT